MVYVIVTIGIYLIYEFIKSANKSSENQNLVDVESNIRTSKKSYFTDNQKLWTRAIVRCNLSDYEIKVIKLFFIPDDINIHQFYTNYILTIGQSLSSNQSVYFENLIEDFVMVTSDSPDMITKSESISKFLHFDNVQIKNVIYSSKIPNWIIIAYPDFVYWNIVKDEDNFKSLFSAQQFVEEDFKIRANRSIIDFYKNLKNDNLECADITFLI